MEQKNPIAVWLNARDVALDHGVDALVKELKRLRGKALFDNDQELSECYMLAATVLNHELCNTRKLSQLLVQCKDRLPADHFVTPSYLADIAILPLPPPPKPWKSDEFIHHLESCIATSGEQIKRKIDDSARMLLQEAILHDGKKPRTTYLSSAVGKKLDDVLTRLNEIERRLDARIAHVADQLATETRFSTPLPTRPAIYLPPFAKH